MLKRLAKEKYVYRKYLLISEDAQIAFYI